MYQPVLIKTLVDCGGTATIRQLAQALLLQDESQILYERRIKDMPLPVLKKHGVAERDGDLLRLNVDQLILHEKAEVKKICEERLQSFIARRGLGIWDYRMLEDDPSIDCGVRLFTLKPKAERVTVDPPNSTR